MFFPLKVFRDFSSLRGCRHDKKLEDFNVSTHPVFSQLKIPGEKKKGAVAWFGSSQDLGLVVNNPQLLGCPGQEVIGSMVIVRISGCVTPQGIHHL